jgi:hypothetical protein
MKYYTHKDTTWSDIQQGVRAGFKFFDLDGFEWSWDEAARKPCVVYSDGLRVAVSSSPQAYSLCMCNGRKDFERTCKLVAAQRKAYRLRTELQGLELEISDLQEVLAKEEQASK